METPGEEESLRAYVRHVLEQLKRHLDAERLKLGRSTDRETETDTETDKDEL
jgi:hypothetical protein